MIARPRRPKSLTQFRIKGAYAGAWAKSLGAAITPDLTQRLAEILKEEVIAAARIESKRQSLSGKVVLPDNENFFKAFDVRVLGDKTVEVRSTYPMIKSLIEGREPYKMTWLTTANGVGKVPIEKPDGTVIFRVPPSDSTHAWIHPGFEKHRFIQTAISATRARFAAEVERAVADAFKRGKVKI